MSVKTILQKFDYKSSYYHRPNQEWQCGRLAEGKPCHLGPGNGGVCRNSSACSPQKKGDRWVCSRNDFDGGKCQDGPLPDGSCCNTTPPCVPVPSLRRKRLHLTHYMMSLVVGVFLVIVGGFGGEWILSPGPLSSGHAQIGECSSCHSSYDAGPLAWAAHFAADDIETADVANCLFCHEGKGGLAHNQTAEFLAQATIEAEPDEDGSGPEEEAPPFLMLANALNVPIRSNDAGEVACRSCHQEHKGHDASIVELSNTQCQACHSTQFESFADGHPVFGDYPYERRTRIQFDHVAHISKYFTDTNNLDKAPETCRSCHEPDDAGELMLAGDFEANCAACHGAFFQDKPVAFFALPGLDMDSLIDLEAQIGEWPYDAENEEFSAIADLLLAPNEEYVAAREAIDEEGLDLLDLEELFDDDTFLADVETIAWAHKELLYDLLIVGTPNVIERVQMATGTTFTPEEIATLTANLHIDALVTAQRLWFPNLFEEVEAYIEAKEDPDVELPLAAESEPEYDEIGEEMSSFDWAEKGGWFTEDFAFQYQLTGHQDLFMQSWLDFIVTLPQDDETLDPLREAFADARSAGGCVTCHSIDGSDAPNVGTLVNWQSRKPEPRKVAFTEFNHSKHFSLIGDEGCATCHALDTEADYGASFDDWDMSQFSSNFAPLDKSVCAACHQPSVAGDTCTSCHNYHIGEFTPAAVHTEMSDMASK